jgi:hypothetical protein
MASPSGPDPSKPSAGLLGTPAPADRGTTLVRGVGLGSATALNMIDMIGVGPFITSPLIISAAGGPQAMLGWILGAALALCPLLPRLAPFDLLHSRLAAKPRGKVGSRLIWGAVAALALLAGAAWVFFDWRQSAAEVAELRQTRDEMKDNVETAKAFIARVNATRTWYERRPNYLECLRTITLCFPEEGRIWTSSLTLRDRKSVV